MVSWKFLSLDFSKSPTTNFAVIPLSCGLQSLQREILLDIVSLTVLFNYGTACRNTSFLFKIFVNLKRDSMIPLHSLNCDQALRFDISSSLFTYIYYDDIKIPHWCRLRHLRLPPTFRSIQHGRSTCTREGIR